jgi:hypothetical protein
MTVRLCDCFDQTRPALLGGNGMSEDRLQPLTQQRHRQTAGLFTVVAGAHSVRNHQQRRLLAVGTLDDPGTPGILIDRMMIADITAARNR